MDHVTVSVPGTSANLGPGYDCLGVAVRLANRITVSRGRKVKLAAKPHAMAERAGEVFFATTGTRPFAWRWSIEGEVPQSRGLGSSVTLRLGILCGLDALAGTRLTRKQLFELCAGLEGHPDNAAPAAFGGFTIAGADGALARFAVDAALHFVLLVPEFEVRTADARRVIPSQVPHGDAVVNAANTARIAAAFASTDYRLLRGAFADRLHQPYRTPLLPELPGVIAAGERAGALGGFLSGSGSTIACVALRNPERIATAMQRAMRTYPSTTVVTRADNRGFRILPQ